MAGGRSEDDRDAFDQRDRLPGDDLDVDARAIGDRAARRLGPAERVRGADASMVTSIVLSVDPVYLESEVTLMSLTHSALLQLCCTGSWMYMSV